MRKESRLSLFGGAVLLIGLLAATGCSSGPSLVPVKGVVKVDGKPAKGAVLTFIKVGADKDSMPATAVAGEDGSFTLVTGERTGVEAGKYKVNVFWPDPSKVPSLAERMRGASIADNPDLLNGKYSAGKSPLEAEVKSGVPELPPFELTTT